MDKKGELTHAAARDKAHSDRVTAIVWHKNFLYSVSYSGSLKMWDGTTLELVAHVSKAHEGGRIHCAAAGPDGFLYTGGDDKVGLARSELCTDHCMQGTLCRRRGLMAKCLRTCFWPVRL